MLYFTIKYQLKNDRKAEGKSPDLAAILVITDLVKNQLWMLKLVGEHRMNGNFT